ncbi:MAG: HD-GYP domain-containing protein [Betaproteobacteria bacterium]
MINRPPRQSGLPALPFILGIAVLLTALRLLATTVSIRSLAENAGSLFFFFVLYATAEVLYVKLPKGGGVSVGLAIILACAAIHGPGPTALVSGLGMLAALVFGSPKAGWIRYLGNFGQVALSTFAAGWMFQTAGGSLEGVSFGRNALAFFLASLVFFVVNVTLVIAFLSSLSRQPIKTFWPDIRHNLASYFALVPLGILVALIHKNYGIGGSALFFGPLLLARYSFLRYLSTRDAGMKVGQAFAAALEAKDSYTKGHSDRVAGYAEQVARMLKLSEDDVETIKFAAALHDIGKIGVSEWLLNKPGELTSAELEEIREHASLGAEMLEKVDFLSGVSDIIRYHHEWFDGSNGYPRQRKGATIPLGARILMVCDSYDAMTSDRPYRQSLDQAAAVEELKKGSGTQFDPQVLQAFFKVLATGYKPTDDGGKQSC